MSRSNQQRRAARHRQRQQQGRQATQRAARGPVWQTAEAPFEWLPPTAAVEAEELVGRMLDAARHSERAVASTLTGRNPQVLTLAAERLAAHAQAHLDSLFNHGWQPLDVLHVIRKEQPRLGGLMAQLVTAHPVTRSPSVPPEPWPDQLRTVARDARKATLTEEERLVGLPLLIVGAQRWPRMERIGPVPSEWGRAAGGPRARRADDSGRSRMLDKVRALLAKAESTPYAAEAEAFTAKAQDLMTRHAIDEALLHAAETESIEVHARRVHLQSPYLREKNSLLASVGRANRSRVIFAEHFAISTVIGTPVDADQVELLFTSLLIQATRAMAEAGTARAGSFDRSATFRRSFLTAYAVRIGERLTKADQSAAGSYGAELVPVLKRQETAVNAEFDRLFPHTTTLRGPLLDRRGWDAGRAAADRATFVAGRISSPAGSGGRAR